MVKAYMHKAVSALLELLGRLLVFNRSQPEVGGFVHDIMYGTADRRKQSLDVVIPEGNPPFPVLIHIHGGGFHFMDKKSSTRICKWFAHEGYLVFNINYRLAPAAVFTDQFEDIGKAISWVNENAGKYGGDNERVFIGGESAGAYFAAMYAAAAGNEELAAALSISNTIPLRVIKGLLLFYGAYDMDTVLHTGFTRIEFMARGFLGEDADLYRERARVASPTRHVDAGYPPSFLFSGEGDNLHSQSVDFDRALTAAGVPHRTLFFDRTMHPEAIHGFLSAFFFSCTGLAMKAALEFMEENLSRAT